MIFVNQQNPLHSALIPFGVLEFDTGHSTVVYGNLLETSDFLVDALEKWYALRKEVITTYQSIEIFLDNRPQINSRRTQFIKRIINFACQINKKIHLVYYPPYHSKYNPIERFWATLENYWNGTLLTSVDKVIYTTKNIRWKGITPTVQLLDKTYQKGVKLSPKQMQIYDNLLIRKANIPKWDVEIVPNQEMRALFIE